VTKGSQTVNYTYDAGGQRLKADFGSGKVYDYVAGLVYVNDSLEFVPTAEGKGATAGPGATYWPDMPSRTTWTRRATTAVLATTGW